MNFLERVIWRIRKRLDTKGRTNFIYLKGRRFARKDQVHSVFQRFQPFDTGIELIRVGAVADGGYLLPDDLEGIVACFSPGVDVTTAFDSQIAAMGIPCFLADASIEDLDQDHPLITFDRLFVGPETRGNVISMHDWLAKYAPAKGDLLLQMDIEGAEYDTLIAMNDADLARFRIITLELHNLEMAFARDGNERLTAFMDKLLSHFVICHIHPNNYYSVSEIDGIAFPSLPELTLLRKDRVRREIAPTDRFPHPLDAANVVENPDWVCPPFWKG